MSGRLAGWGWVDRSIGIGYPDAGTVVTFGRMPETHFDEWIADHYEALWPELFDPAVVDSTVSFLAHLTAMGPALEFGVGTGRIALPLSRRDVRVHGIGLSPAMAARLRGQTGGAEIAVTVGDFATASAGGPFALVYLLRNTITNLTSQDEQVRAFGNAAAHLRPGGCFVVENYVPELRRLPPGETTVVFAATDEHLGFEEYDVAAQIAVSHHYWTIEGPTEDVHLAAPLPVAVRAGPHGATSRPGPARAVGRLEPHALHQREPQPHLGLGEATSPVTFAMPGPSPQPRDRRHGRAHARSAARADVRWPGGTGGAPATSPAAEARRSATSRPGVGSVSEGPFRA